MSCSDMSFVPTLKMRFDLLCLQGPYTLDRLSDEISRLQVDLVGYGNPCTRNIFEYFKKNVWDLLISNSRFTQIASPFAGRGVMDKCIGLIKFNLPIGVVDGIAINYSRKLCFVKGTLWDTVNDKPADISDTNLAVLFPSYKTVSSEDTDARRKEDDEDIFGKKTDDNDEDDEDVEDEEKHEIELYFKVYDMENMLKELERINSVAMNYGK